MNKLLDVGGGSGCYAIAIANANSDMQATIMELKPVCAVTEDYITKAGVSDRWTQKQ